MSHYEESCTAGVESGDSIMSYTDPLPTEPYYAENQHILKWWTPAHDQLLVTQIAEEHWAWYWGITDRIVEITPPETLAAWQEKDPLCSKYAWYNVLMYFAAARAEQLGYTKAIRRPRQKTCALCKKRFSESSIPPSVVKHLGIDKLDFCINCIGDKFLPGSGSDTLSKESIIKYLRDLANLLQSVPPQSFGESLASLAHLTTQERASALKLQESKPTIKRVKAVFGSWLNALIEAGVLEDGTRKTSRGIHCIAKDGHICLSLGEKTIDDYLYVHGVHHEKEPRYPEGNFRGDFKVGTTFIEYFGLTGNPEYDSKTNEKMRICKKHGVSLVAIYPVDLVNPRKLEGKLALLIGRVES